MEIGQFNRARQIRERIRKLKIMRSEMERNGGEAKIGDYKIPRNSKEVILDMCQKEIDELENEFENL